ncbi:glutamyl-tRNA(Gln) amidotransferase [Cordyceps militaris CM01]|uniref:Glutamyl-tRNA(Gln) amidotransferase n=1 Tax=Cordyceps militaris (strain CM01) TaxID=983644 RepID=G3J3P2_CORMM|nr:glutamyl-tRNA(Gln) amidotransferase [Cordyceps militaris CM01]EGX95718.1 glutamyl-tRNA(Gln) amidotransferase [Cordyceps militaris CM01]
MHDLPPWLMNQGQRLLWIVEASLRVPLPTSKVAALLHCVSDMNFSLVAGLLHIATVTATRVVSTGSTVKVGSIHYFVPPWYVGKVGNADVAEGDDLQPVTVINTKTASLNESTLSQVTKLFLESDDVINQEFLKGMSLEKNSHEKRLTTSSCVPDVGNSTVPDGPYFLSQSRRLYSAYRLYTDFAGAFSETSITAPDGSHTVLPANVPGQALAVAVPSRLSFTKTPEKPLAGVRLGVKDIYDIAGLKTSNGNRAWYHLYPEANETASAVQKLVDAGAVILGKMKTSQFANGETATADWVDSLAPFNPRGDGYQDPSSSSAGPAAGTGMCGVLNPGGYGLTYCSFGAAFAVPVSFKAYSEIAPVSKMTPTFANTLTTTSGHGLSTLDHTMPLSPTFDTAGLLARDPILLCDAATVLYQPNIANSSAYPKRILAVGFPTGSSAKLDQMLQGFLHTLADLLSARSAAFNLTEHWAATNPGAGPLLAMINSTYEVLSAQEQARLVRDPFYTDYAARHDGRRPHVNPAPLRRWALGDEADATLDEAVANKTRFMDWFNGHVLKVDEVTCSSDLFVYVPRTPAPKYRDTYWTGPQAPGAFSTSRIPVMAEIPDIVIPIGEIEYESKVTNHTEYLPVTVDLMAAKGCDGMLFSLIREMHKVGMISEVRAGRSLVNGGDIMY